MRPISTRQSARLQSPPTQERIRFSPQQLVGLLVVAFAVTEYSTLWIYPNIKAEILFSAGSDALGKVTSSVTRAGGAQFRVLVWMIFAAGYGMFLLTRPISSVLTILGPYLLFIIFAILSAIAGDSVGTSIWFVMQWLVMVLAASVAGQLSSPATMRNAGEFVFAFGAFGSLLLAVVAPSMAINASGGSMLLHGLFAGKNMAGWFTCLGFIWIYAFRTRPLNWLSYLTMFALLVMLVWSGSKTSLAVLMAAIAYYQLMRFLQRLRIHWITASLATAVIVGASVLTAQTILPMLIEMLGKDPTLTGRTAIWDAYLRFMQDEFWLGKGPGAFAFASELNQRVAETMEEGQRVYGVHNMYLALFGDIGFLGAMFNVVALVYVLLIPPFRERSPGHMVAAVIALAILISGFSEAHEHIVPGIATFLLVAARSSSVRQAVATRAKSLPVNPYFDRRRTGGYAGGIKASQAT